MATVTYPPTIVPSPNTPAEEWAQQTTTVVNSAGDEHNSVENPVTTHTTTTTTTVSELAPETMGIPGSYPGIISDYDTERLKENTREALAAASDTAQELYQKAEQTAKEYIPVAQQNINEKAQTVYETAEQAARQYLPESVIGKLEQVGVLGSKPIPNGYVESDSRPVPYTSMPTDEIGPFHPTRGGVGTLPGQPTEAAVAKLPDERIEEMREEQLPTHETQTGPTPGGVGSLPGTRSETSIAKLPEERLQSKDTTSVPTPDSRLDHLRGEMPSREVDTGPTHGGVGTLPGPRSESGVAKLPEERITEAKDSSSPVVAVGTTGLKDTKKSAAEASDKKPPQTILPLTEATSTPSGLTAPPKTGQHVPIDDNNINNITGQETRGTGAGLHGVEPAKPRTVIVGDDSSGSSTADTHEKVSMKTKMKANAKILGGKLTRDKELVEEGKSLKAGN